MDLIDFMGSPFLEYLSKIDAAMISSGRPAVRPAERLSLGLAAQVAPLEGRGFDWLLEQAMSCAKHVYLQPAGDFAGFVFIDRSVLILLQSGYLYAVPSAVTSNLSKIDAWLTTHGVDLTSLGRPAFAS